MSKVIIIGGGIIGLSSAYYLQKKGHSVTILDMGSLTDNCSYGNAGMIVPSHFVPLAAPGMIAKGIKWMFSNKSPFSIRPSASFSLIDWGARFFRHANIQHVNRSAEPLRDISLLSKTLYDKLAGEVGSNFGLAHKGILAYFKTEKVAEEEMKLVEKAMELGLDMEMLNSSRCMTLQPNLELDVLGAIHYRCDSHLSPSDLVGLLTRHLEASGVQIMRNEKVVGAHTEGGKVKYLYTETGKQEADDFVLAAGAWSPEVGKMLDVHIPLMPGKGYSFMDDHYNNQLEIPALLCEAKVAITPMNNSVRFSGTMEIGKMNTKIRTARLKGIIDSVPKYFPQVMPSLPPQEKVWQGFRPCSADGLPYIGYGKMKNLIIATGHGMMGVSLGLGTGQLVSELVSGENTSLNLKPFALNR